MPKNPEIVGLPATPELDLSPIHERLQNAEQQVADLRERAARTETRVEEAIAHNPASEEALRLATDAHNTAQQALKSVQKLAKEAAAVPEKTLKEITPPAPPPEDPPQDQLPVTPAQGNLEPRKPFWHKLL